MKYLSLDERKMIEKMIKSKNSNRDIASVLSRSHTTIGYEINHNKTADGEYDAQYAHYRFLSRQAKKGNKSKLEMNPELKSLLIEYLTKDQWSPEQISGFIKLLSLGFNISHETIYQYIYSEEGKRLKLWLNLRHKKRPKRVRHGSRKLRKDTIKFRVPITERPKIVNLKKEVGHLESDSMIFSKQKPILSVQVERISQKCVLTKLPNKTAIETKYALTKAIEEYGQNQVKSITYDNGSENALHYEINENFNLESYFCRAYASWQKGLVENINKLIRQYLPRYTRMDQMSDEDIYEIQEKLNNRPRKTLKYLTPNHVYQILIQGGRIRA